MGHFEQLTNELIFAHKCQCDMIKNIKLVAICE